MVTRNDDSPQENDSMSPQSEEVWGMLEEAGVDESLIEKVTTIIDQLSWAANRGCCACEDRMLSEAYGEREPDTAKLLTAHEVSEVLLMVYGGGADIGLPDPDGKVMESIIERWTDSERQEVVAYAGAVHADAGDNDVENFPARPTCLSQMMDEMDCQFT